MKAIVTVTLKPSILDPQGEAVLHAVQGMGLKEVKSVRIGKHIELEIQGGDETTLKKKLEQISGELLSNPVMENFHLDLRTGG
ncbi:MAG: phosphoribosylformylglycinamidine synthase subunit PurS [Verrucomicrobia bacterium]|jgi:phosphoribosylformylglycinamidine synthase subunit PurS|nr:phosphoribosylformylglycinamidine synthase subunit PurS [Verrucomicrobiota bacterium]